MNQGRGHRKTYARGVASRARFFSKRRLKAAVASVVVFEAEVRDEVFAAQMPERVLELHQLDEDVVLGVEAGRGHRRLEVEREPLLYPTHPDALREVEE